MRTDHAIKPILGIAAALAFSLLAGCGASDDPGAASPRPESTEQANEAASPPAAREQASLPDGFPGQFPLPPDFVVTEGRFTPGDSMTQANYLVRGHSAIAVAGLAEFFKQELADAGYELLQAAPVPADTTAALVYFRGREFRDCSVQLRAADPGTDILISLPLDN